MKQTTDEPLNPFQALIVAIQFLSVIPVGKQPAPSEAQIGESLSWYPLVGLLLGTILFLAASALIHVFPPFLSAALVLTLWVMLTGGLHLDGFADSADAWMGGLGSREKTLHLLKDPTSGPIAIAAVVLLLLLKLLTLELILSQHQAILVLWPLIFGRVSAGLLFVSTPYARESGLGSALAKYKDTNHVWLGACAVSLIASYALGWLIAPLLVILGLSFWYLRSRMLKRLDGCTGDTAGAQIEIIECITLLCLSASLSL